MVGLDSIGNASRVRKCRLSFKVFAIKRTYQLVPRLQVQPSASVSILLVPFSRAPRTHLTQRKPVGRASGISWSYSVGERLCKTQMDMMFVCLVQAGGKVERATAICGFPRRISRGSCGFLLVFLLLGLLEFCLCKMCVVQVFDREKSGVQLAMVEMR